MSASVKFIVTTTIHAPTEAIRRFDEISGWTLIVVGDQRTPSGYTLQNGIYLSPEEQEKLAPELSDLIGWNCIQRRNLGFVLALSLGGEIIATVDDDNIPYDGWGQGLMVGREVELKSFEAPNGCFDPVGATEHSHLWHRGYPLQLLQSRNYGAHASQTVHVDVQADFWNGDPDVDAVCRLEHRPEVEFAADTFPFTSGAISPFNSQNTFLSAAALAHYFVLPGVGRMDDIWAAFHLQSKGFRVAYGAPSVYQDRNAQDLTQNLNDEVLGYQQNAALVEAINAGTYAPHDFWPERTVTAYEAYRRRVSP
ncbi:MAG: hypothetical protein AAGI06_07140 [Pseudomonadota bacterium]